MALTLATRLRASRVSWSGFDRSVRIRFLLFSKSSSPGSFLRKLRDPRSEPGFFLIKLMPRIHAEHVRMRSRGGGDGRGYTVRRQPHAPRQHLSIGQVKDEITRDDDSSRSTSSTATLRFLSCEQYSCFITLDTGYRLLRQRQQDEKTPQTAGRRKYTDASPSPLSLAKGAHLLTREKKHGTVTRFRTTSTILAWCRPSREERTLPSASSCRSGSCWSSSKTAPS